MKKGDFAELKITDISSEGNGIGKVSVDGGLFTVFVEGGVPGDIVRAGITDVKKNYALAKATGFIEKSKSRLPDEDVCPHIRECGGCPYGMIDYETQLILKEKQVKDKLERIGGIKFSATDSMPDKIGLNEKGDLSGNIDCQMSEPKTQGKALLRPIIAMDEPYHYRNKATIAVFNDVVGFKGKKSNMVVDCRECRLQNPKAVAAADALRAYIKETNNKVSFSKMVVKTTSLDEVMVLIYTTDYTKKQESKSKKGESGSRKSKGHEKTAAYSFDKIMGKLKLEDLCYGIDDAVDNCLESIYIDDTLIAGKNTVIDKVGSLSFEISPLSFYQVNHEQMIKLYDKVVEYADLKAGNTILDLYCGVGTIGLYMIEKQNKSGQKASQSKEPSECVSYNGMVIGIESVKPAIIDANRNAVINHIVNARYFAGKAEDELPFMMGMKKLYRPNEVNEMTEREPEYPITHADVAVLDPPRAGCDKALLEAVVKAQPDRIVYVSCDPGTLSRDIKYLTEGVKELGYEGYEFIEATPVDMFPHTGHVETCVLLSRAGK